MDYITNYVSQVQQTLDYMPVERLNQVIGILHEARLANRLIYIMGNGGSASTASHFVADLSKNTRREGWPSFRVLGLTDNMAMFSAYANDEGYENVFSQQLANFVQPGDIVIAISASGNSPNVLRAMELANQIGATTIGFTGFTGGYLSQLVDIDLHVPSNIIEQVEDIHLMFEHMICKALREHIEDISPVSLENRVSQTGMRVYQGQPAKPSHPSLDLLYQINHELEGQLEPQDLLLRTLQLSLKSIGAVSGSIITLNDAGEVSDAIMAYAGKVHVSHTGELTDMIQQGLAGWVIENRQAALVANTSEDPRWLPSSWEQDELASRSAVSVPLTEGERVIGVLTLVHSQAGKFTQDHLVLLASIAMFASFHAAKSLSLQRI